MKILMILVILELFGCGHGGDNNISKVSPPFANSKTYTCGEIVKAIQDLNGKSVTSVILKLSEVAESEESVHAISACLDESLTIDCSPSDCKIEKKEI